MVCGNLCVWCVPVLACYSYYLLFVSFVSFHDYHTLGQINSVTYLELEEGWDAHPFQNVGMLGFTPITHVWKDLWIFQVSINKFSKSRRKPPIAPFLMFHVCRSNKLSAEL